MDVAIVETLRGCGFFSRLDDERRARLLALAVRKRYRRGTVVFREGEDPPGLFIVVRGLVRIFKLGPGGKEHVLHLAEPGQTFAEVAVLGSFPCPANADVVDDAECVLLPATPFTRLLQDDHELSLQMLASMASWIRHLVGLLEGIVLRDAAGRLAGFLLETDQRRGPGRPLALPGLKRHIASHLDLTSETLSRMLRRFRDEHLIEELRPGRVVIVDRARLERVAGGQFPRV